MAQYKILLQYRIYKIEEKDIHAPIEDFYTKGGSQTDTIKTLVDYGESFPTMEEAVKRLENSDFYMGEYTILPVFTKD